MADSDRLLVMKRLTTLIEGTVLDTYAGLDPALPATLDGVVFRGKVLMGTEVDHLSTMVSILEAPRPQGANFTGEGQVRKSSLLLLVQGRCPDDKLHPSDPIYGVLDAIERRLDRVTRLSGTTGDPVYPEHYLLGPSPDGNGRLAVKFEVMEGVVRPPTEGISSKCFFYLMLQVGLARIRPQ